jgi:glycosyltransferase involved in cell wall biosynthesis
MSRLPRVCFHVPYLYPALVPGPVEFAGGAEIQIAGIARGLAARGYEVSAVACHLGQPRRTVIDGVTLLASFDPSAGLPVVRFFHPRLTSTLAALCEANADIYYVNGSGFPAGIAADVARSRGARFVFHVASDYDLMKDLPLQTNPRDRWWQRRALRHADAIIAQTEVQRRMLRENFGRDSTVVPNWVEMPERAVDPGGDGSVVWLGTYKPIKRPDWFLTLARRMPERRFVMAGVIPPPPDTRECWEQAQAAARELANLEVRGFVPHSELAAWFSFASLFVHTSPVEGFPNTVLEAWAHGLPTVTAVDPDGLVTRERLGAVASSEDELVARVRELMADPGTRRTAGERARQLARERHGLPVVLDRIEEVLRSAVAAGRSS